MATTNKTENTALERGLGLKEAVALNMIEIVGIGPFVVSSLVIRAMGGPQALIAWLAGALLATLDAFVWSELGAAMPKAGGTYVFRGEAPGPELRAGGVGPVDVLFVRVANVGAGAAFRGVGVDWLRKVCGISVPLHAVTGEGDFRRTRRLDRNLVIPADRDDRKNFRFAVDRRRGNHAVADLGRGHAFQRQDGV